MIVEHDVTVHQGDVLDVLRTLPGGSVNCVVTSPPYYGLRDYGVDGQIGLESSPAEYVAAMVGVFGEVRRVLTDDGVLWLNLGDSYSGRANGGSSFDRHRGQGHRAGVVARQINTTAFAPYKSLLGIPWRSAFALIDDGWTLRNDVIWHKPNAMPESVIDRLSTRYEHVFLFSKSRRYWFDLDAIREPVAASTIQRLAQRTDERAGSVRANGGTRCPPGQRRPKNGGPDADKHSFGDGGRNPGDVWTVATVPFSGAHFAVMPPALARRCILAGCPDDGTVLDPFAGSGTTLMVARALGRKSVGIELNPDYIDIIRNRIGQEPLDFGTAS